MPDPLSLPALDWEKQGGLVPAVVQDAHSHRVLMLGYMSRESLRATVDSGLATFYSRSRQCLWTKGGTSGNRLRVVALDADCDADALLLRVEPEGPTCHLGRTSCFADARGSGLGALDALVARRAAAMPEGHYTTKLLSAGVRRVAQKVGEEGVETALAAVAEDDAALLGEAADLAYHLLVLLRARGLGLADVERVLASRAG
ncbi:MAG TPA: bifunctional phosphoribosyl-AMP cyclohydrolase/phosphoribosyl-ATP diphosphatase HisIE [Luteimonas sp.]